MADTQTETGGGVDEVIELLTYENKYYKESRT